MSVFITSLGQTASGATVFTPQNTTEAIPLSGNSSEALVSLGADNYSFSSNVPRYSYGGVVGNHLEPLSNADFGTFPLTTLGEATPYSAAAEVHTFTYTQQSSLSTVNALLSTSASFQGLSGGSTYFILYVLLSGTYTYLTSTYNSAEVASEYSLDSSRGMGILAPNQLSPLQFSLCAFSGSGSSYPIVGPFNYDSIRIIETISPSLLTSNAVSSSPFIANVTGATSTLMGNIPIASGTTACIEGSWMAFNTTSFVNANGGTFQLVVYNNAGTLVLVGDNVIMNIMYTSTAYPNITIALGVNGAIQIYGNGNSTADNFLFRVQYGIN